MPGQGVTPLPAPGEIVCKDYRTSTAKEEATTSPDRPIKALQWNVERGYQLPGIIRELKKLDADILCLQELDIACERSGSEDVGDSIASALNYNYAFLCEFEELHSPLRSAQTQGGGVHGNGILTKFDLSSLRAVEHTRHPVNWEKPEHTAAKREPRHGRRFTLAAVVQTGDLQIQVYCCHLEVFCGMLDRMWQYSDILADSRKQEQVHQMILGDLNTMANGIARLSPNFCCDAMRWKTLGTSEAQFWAKHVFAISEQEHNFNQHLLKLGLPRDVCENIVNPGFVDPFDPQHDITLENLTYRIWGISLMKGKLDWVLLNGLQAVSKSMGNDDYKLSDHKWLMVEIQKVE